MHTRFICTEYLSHTLHLFTNDTEVQVVTEDVAEAAADMTEVAAVEAAVAAAVDMTEEEMMDGKSFPFDL